MKSFFSFFLDWIRFPLRTRAIFPSSRSLSRAIASQVPLEGAGVILELGSGTGVVTRALLDRGLNIKRLICVEMSSRLISVLQEECPGIRVLQEDAYDLKGLLQRHKIGPIDAIVSSLPLMAKALDERISFLRQCLDILPLGAPVVQFTYNAFSYIRFKESDVQSKRVAWVWRNIPPAAVWVYRRLKIK